MADDIVVFANSIADGGKDPFSKGDDDQVDDKEDERHLVDFFLYLSYIIFVADAAENVCGAKKIICFNFAQTDKFGLSCGAAKWQIWYMIFVFVT